MSASLPGDERLGLLPAVTELGAEGFPAQQLLVAAHVQGRRIEDALVAVERVVGVGIVLRINVDELDVEIGVGAGAGDLELRRDGTGDGHILFKRIGLIDQHVGPVAGEALVVDHVALRHGVGGVADKRHGVVGIADVLIQRLLLRRAGRS